MLGLRRGAYIRGLEMRTSTLYRMLERSGFVKSKILELPSDSFVYQHVDFNVIYDNVERVLIFQLGEISGFDVFAVYNFKQEKLYVYKPHILNNFLNFIY